MVRFFVKQKMVWVMVFFDPARGRCRGGGRHEGLDGESSGMCTR